jgi:hypothetical protein
LGNFAHQRPIRTCPCSHMHSLVCLQKACEIYKWIGQVFSFSQQWHHVEPSLL